MLPVYHEAHMISRLTENIAVLDYPADRLDVMIICEPDDIDTITNAEAVTGDIFRVFVTDGLGPRTKPNALNAALPHAKGSIITVYDAEDRPHPAQLRAAALALNTDSNLAVVQAPLTYYNATQNWLTRQFTLEYDALFQVWLPFLAKLGLPFPLGGTSNHIRREALEDVGGWDPYNVTEDADLSFRFAAHQWQLGYITPPTHEEAVSSWIPWNNQRSRWVKGYMQTWLTHMKRPFLPGGRTGWRRALTLQLTLGVTLLAGLFHVPAVIILLGVLWLGWITHNPVTLPPLFLNSLAFTYISGVLIGIVGARRMGRPALYISAFAMPLYWLLLIIPTAIALREMFSRPFYWNKTEHSDTGDAAQTTALDTEPDFHATRT